MDQFFITRIVEAALLAANQPLTIVQMRGLFTLDEPAPEGSIEQALTDLRAACEGRGIELAETASGYRFQVQADVHAWVARLWTERQTKYTRATLETLAIIAYRQPITRGEIEQVRGVAVSSNIIKALEEREWIRVIGHRDVPGRPELLGTTRGFLDYFGLKSLDQLPPLSELKDFGELDPQLSFVDPDAPKPAPIVAGISDDAEHDAASDEDDADPHSTEDSTEASNEDGNQDNNDQDTPDDGNDTAIAHEPRNDDAIPASDDTHTALVDDDDSTGA
ncbi:MAG: SMC-Scp complex subunit ScpB [Xanthomonadales bacterium]|nr:SMC-Scp complex subunit ScpB [Xanthomonadales bacterium]